MTIREHWLNDGEATLRRKNAELQSRLDEAEAIIATIRSGSVDAITSETPAGVAVFTRQGSEHPYRVMVETMSEGAVTVAPMAWSFTATNASPRCWSATSRMLSASRSSHVSAHATRLQSPRHSIVQMRACASRLLSVRVRGGSGQ